MERLQAHTFQLRPKAGQENLMRRFAGCCRFLWNKAFALEKETCENEGKRLGFSLFCKFLRDWKKENDTSFLVEAHSQILQQVLKDLDRAYKNFFAKRADFPRFKRKVMMPFALRRVSSWTRGTAAYFFPKSAGYVIGTVVAQKGCPSR